MKTWQIVSAKTCVGMCHEMAFSIFLSCQNLLWGWGRTDFPEMISNLAEPQWNPLTLSHLWIARVSWLEWLISWTPKPLLWTGGMLRCFGRAARCLPVILAKHPLCGLLCFYFLTHILPFCNLTCYWPAWWQRCPPHPVMGFVHPLCACERTLKISGCWLYEIIPVRSWY